MASLGDLVGVPPRRKELSCDIFVIPDAKVGVEVEVENCGTIRGLDTDLWKAKDDHSLRNNGKEFVTNGGLVGTALRDAIYHICDFAQKKKYSTGEPRAGIHLHLDVTDLNVEEGELLRLVTNYMLVEHVFFAFCGEWRRDCGYCVPYDIGKNDFRLLGSLLTNRKTDNMSKDYTRSTIEQLSKYQALNLKPLISLGTVEFRALPTTFDADRILLWINMVLALKKSATDKDIGDPLAYLSSVGPEKFCEKILTPEIFSNLKGFLSEREMWKAVDDAQTLYAIGTQYTLIPRQVKQGLNSLVLKKMNAEKVKQQKEDIERNERREDWNPLIDCGAFIKGQLGVGFNTIAAIYPNARALNATSASAMVAFPAVESFVDLIRQAEGEAGRLPLFPEEVNGFRQMYVRAYLFPALRQWYMGINPFIRQAQF